MIKSIIHWLFCNGNENMIKEWNEQFPGKCIVCSYHAFGYREGLTEDATPPPHECLYAKKKTITS